LTWGVWGIQVADLPRRLVADPAIWTFAPEHTPQDTNYYHCDIRAFLNGVHQKGDATIDEEVQLRFRVLIRKKIQHLLRPLDSDAA